MKSTIKLSVLTLMVFSFIPVFGSITASKHIEPKSFFSKEDSSCQCQALQISFVPYFGTQGFQSDSICTDVSINILGGIVNEVKSFEFGGMVNIVRKNAGRCQLAGYGNIVMGTSSGFQGAGLFNIAKSLDGVQAVGILNTAGYADGIQISGMVNHASKGVCSQIAGISNSTLQESKFQIAGIVNYAPVSQLFQIGGLVNITKETPFQIGGLVNQAQKVEKFQIAGLVNNASEVKGAQISGIINRATYFEGLQLGLINISDSCKGVPIGILSIVKNGYHTLELSGDELFYTNIAFRSGLQKLHSILLAGIQPDNFSNPLWSYGVGMGSLFNLSSKTFLGIDMTFQHVIKSEHVDNNFLYKVGAGIDRKLFGKTSIYLGVTYNFLLSNKQQSRYDELYSTIAPYTFTENEFHRHNLKTWAGFKVGLRFF